MSAFGAETAMFLHSQVLLFVVNGYRYIGTLNVD